MGSAQVTGTKASAPGGSGGGLSYSESACSREKPVGQHKITLNIPTQVLCVCRPKDEIPLFSFRDSFEPPLPVVGEGNQSQVALSRSPNRKPDFALSPSILLICLHNSQYHTSL